MQSAHTAEYQVACERDGTSDQESRPTVAGLSITSLQWAVGTFCFAMGALMLVAPHQFNWPAFAWVQGQLTVWGVGFLAAGVGLLAVVTLAPRFGQMVLIHLWAGSLLLALGAGLVRTGGWSGASAYLVLGVGTAVAPLVARLVFRHPWLHGEAFSVLIGFGALISGMGILALPEQFTPSRYDLVRPLLGWFGLAFSAFGILLCVSQTSRLLPSWLGRVASVLLGSVFFVFAAMISIPNHDWSIFYGGFGTALVLLSVLGPRVRRFDPRSLRTRLSLVLAAAVAVPLVVMVSVFARDQESQAVAEQLGRQQVLAGALAQNVADYITLHHAAVKLLATVPGLLTLSPSDQHALLKNSKEAYPDIVGFGTVAANGDPIARADDRTGTSWIGDVVFEDVRRTKQPAIGIRMSPIIDRPIFTLGVPILDTNGTFTGMVSSSLEASRIAAFLARTDFEPGTRTYLVDMTGLAIANTDQDVEGLADLSARPSVAAMLADPATGGALRIQGPQGGVLASYARVPELGWGVVVERPAAAGLEPIRTKLDLLFGGLLVVVAAAAGFGVVAAGLLSAPLATLTVAVDRLATGDSSAPLPRAGLTEIVRLAATFGHLRKQLDARTAERELAEDALKERALHDALTGLPNRTLFTDRLEHALARTDRQADSVAVLFLDLNHFKSVNDKFGHEQGDTLLITVAERLRACMRHADTAARFGGDEFTILLEGIDGQDGAIRVATRIAAELARPVHLEGGEVVVPASIGIAVGGQRSSTKGLLHEADVAMYRAKRNGSGHTYAVFEPTPDARPLSVSS